MNKKQKYNLTRILIAAILMIVLHFVPVGGILRFILYMIPYGIVGYDIILKAGKGIKNRQPLDECLLMVIATIGAILIALIDTGDYVEAVAVMLFYQIGEWFQSYAIGRSRKSISELMDIRPDYANVRSQDGQLEQVDPDEVEIGTIIICQPGEKIPIDGVVEKGYSSLNTSALTGESLPRTVHEGDEVISGCINMSGVLEIRTTKEFGESTASQILDLVENASSRKSKSEDFISKFARIYTPVVVGCALALAIIPPVIRLLMSVPPLWGTWIYRALIFLVISCPCALVISIPLSFFAGIGGASRAGILVKGSNYLEALASTKTLVCDKTGTLTEGSFKVVGIYPAGQNQALMQSGATEFDQAKFRLLEFAALAESASSHPIGKSLMEAYREGAGYLKKNLKCSSETAALVTTPEVEEIEEIPGEGVQARIGGRAVAVGNLKLMRRVLTTAGNSVSSFDEKALNNDEAVGSVVHVSLDGEYAGHIVISDVIKETSPEAIRALRESGIERIVMLTGDQKSVAEKVASELDIAEVYSELLPADKVAKVEQLLGEGTLAFVGDGVNDAPVLSRADIGIAMGALGSDAAIEAADVVLMDDDPIKIAKAIRISRKCLRIVKENIWFAIGVKIVCLILGALGIANMWLAIFADVGVMVIAVLNAIRTLFVKNL